MNPLTEFIDAVLAAHPVVAWRILRAALVGSR